MNTIWKITAPSVVAALVGGLALASFQSRADAQSARRGGTRLDRRCEGLPAHANVKAALTAVLGNNGGLNTNMWASIVNRDGIVCSVSYSGENRGSQWPGSRVIAAQKANTANAFSLPDLSLSSANLYAATQPGGFLYGLQESNPVDTSVAYAGPARNFGEVNDPMVGNRIGGINIFGGGLALYDNSGELLGGLGVSGDSSCADHNIAWKVRDALGVDHVPSGVSDGSLTDNITYDITDGVSLNGFGHAVCSTSAQTIAEGLPVNFPLGD